MLFRSGGERAGEGSGARACEAGHWPSRAASGTRCRRGERGRDNGDGTAACRRRQDTSTGAMGRHEAVGRRGVNGRRSGRRSRARLWPASAGFPRRARVLFCLEATVEGGKTWKEPGMLWGAEGRERGWEREGKLLSREDKRDSLLPPHCFLG